MYFFWSPYCGDLRCVATVNGFSDSKWTATYAIKNICESIPLACPIAPLRSSNSTNQKMNRVNLSINSFLRNSDRTALIEGSVSTVSDLSKSG